MMIEDENVNIDHNMVVRKLPIDFGTGSLIGRMSILNS